MIRIETCATNEPAARALRAALVRTLQWVSAEGLTPTVQIERESEDIYVLVINYN